MRPWHKYKVAPKEERTFEGVVFDSKKEMERWQELREKEERGEIRLLLRQQEYPLAVNGCEVGSYVADFTYWEPAGDEDWPSAGSGSRVVEDSKGVVTEAYRLKKKLMKAIYGIEIRETGRRGPKKRRRKVKVRDKELKELRQQLRREVRGDPHVHDLLSRLADDLWAERQAAKKARKEAEKP